MKFLFFYSLIIKIFIHSKIIIPVKYKINDSYEKSNITSIFNSYNTGYLQSEIEVGSNKIPIKFKLTFDSFSLIILNSSINNIPIKYNINESKTSQMFTYKFRFKNEPISEGHLATDIFYLNYTNKTNQNLEQRLRFFLYPRNLDKIVNEGIMGIGVDNVRMYPYIGYNLINNLNEERIINEYVIYFSENDKLFIGEYPEISEPDKFISGKRVDIICSNFNNSRHTYYLFINDIISNNIFIDSEKFLLFNLSNFFMEGTELYRDYIKKYFFDKYLNNSKNKCYYETNILLGDFFYCDKDVNISGIPSLIFQINGTDYNITLDYSDLFALIEDKLFFIIYFREHNEIWKFGYYNIKKLNIAFNQKKKTISFSKKKNKQPKDNNVGGDGYMLIIFIIIIILLVLFALIIISIYFYKKNYGKSGKKDELIGIKENIDSIN